MDYKMNSTACNVTIIPENNDRMSLAYEIQFICYCLLLPIISGAGLVGNTVAFITLWKQQTAPSCLVLLLEGLLVTDTTIIILSLTTMTFLSLSMNNIKMSYFKNVIYPNIFPSCNFLIMTVQQCNVWITVALASERYVAICHPFQSRHLRTKSKSVISLIAISLFSIAFNIPRLFAFVVKPVQCDILNQTVYVVTMTELGKSDFYLTIYGVWMYAICSYIIPILILVSFSIATIRQLVKMSKKNRPSKQHFYKEINMTFFILTVVVCFLICQTPGIFAQLQDVFSDATTLVLFSVSNTVFVFNSSINFFIYTMRSRFTRVLRRFCQSRNNKTFSNVTMNSSHMQLH